MHGGKGCGSTPNNACAASLNSVNGKQKLTGHDDSPDPSKVQHTIYIRCLFLAMNRGIKQYKATHQDSTRVESARNGYLRLTRIVSTLWL